MTTSPSPSEKPGSQTQDGRDDKSMPQDSAKTISEENKETRHDRK